VNLVLQESISPLLTQAVNSLACVVKLVTHHAINLRS